MRIVSANITGSLILNGVDVTDSFVSSSVDSGSFTQKIDSLQSSTSSLNSFTSSINTTIKSKMDSESVISGSIQVNITGTTGYSTFSSSISSSVGSLSSSVATTTSDLSSSIGGLSSSVATTTSNLSSSVGSLSGSIATTTLNLSSSVSSSIGDLSGSVATTTSNLSSSVGNLSSSVATTTSDLSSSIGSLSSSVATNTSGLSGRITTIEGRYATTGSNVFVGSQVITGSLYITTDLIVQGSSSLQNITASAVSIGTNTVILNTDTPAVRFAGISVQDSGSNAGVTGSIFWDGLCNRWVYSNPSGVGYSGGLLISGPRNIGTLGDEVGTTSCALMIGQGGDHITSSAIFHYGNSTCFYGTSFISGSGQICAPSFVGGSSIGTCAIFNTLTAGNSSGASVNISTNGNNGTSETPLQTNLNFYGYNSNLNGQIRVDDISGTAQLGTMKFYTWNSSQVLSLTLGHTGIACFANTVCVPRLQVLNTNSIVVIEGTATNGEGTLTIAGKNSSGTYRSAIFKYDNTDVIRLGTANAIPMRFETSDVARMSISSTGISCFACQVCSAGFYSHCAVGINSFESTIPLQIKRWVGSGGTLKLIGNDNLVGMPSVSFCNDNGGGTAFISMTSNCQININGSIYAYPSGNVGIGNSSPSTTLHTTIQTCWATNGTVACSYPVATFSQSDCAGGARGLQIGVPTGGINSPVFLKVNNTGARFSIIDQSNCENFTISGVRVGIGTTTPCARLETVGSGFILRGGWGLFCVGYTGDGLFNTNAQPNFLSTNAYGGTFSKFGDSSGLVLGYQDNGAGLYSPAYGFEVRSTDGRPVTGNVVRAIVMRDTDTGALPFWINNNGSAYYANRIGIGIGDPGAPLSIRCDSSSTAASLDIASCSSNAYRYVTINAGAGIEYCIPGGTSQSPYIQVQGGSQNDGGGSFKIRTGTMGSVSDKLNIFQNGVACFSNIVCAGSFSTSGFIRAHNSMRTFNIQKNLDERLSNSNYFRIASTSGGGFQVIVHSFSQNVGVGWSQSQIFHAVSAPYWGGWVGSSGAVSTIGDGSGIISSAVIGQDGTITFRVSTGNNGTNTQGTINSFIQVNAFNIDGITLTAL